MLRRFKKEKSARYLRPVDLDMEELETKKFLSSLAWNKQLL